MSDFNKNTTTHRLSIRKIENNFKKFPLDYRMAYTLKELNGLDLKETAEILNMTETQIQKRVNRVKVNLKKEINPTQDLPEIYEFNLVHCDAIVNRVMEDLENI